MSKKVYLEEIRQELLLIDKPFSSANIEVKTAFGLLIISYNKDRFCLEYKGNKYLVSKFYMLIIRKTNELKSISVVYDGSTYYAEDISYEYLDFILRVISDFNKLNS